MYRLRSRLWTHQNAADYLLMATYIVRLTIELMVPMTCNSHVDMAAIPGVKCGT